MESCARQYADNRDVFVIGGAEVADLLTGKEAAILRTIRRAYEIHGQGETSLPHSTFLRFPFSPADRIIALPAYLGGDVNAAGVKWVSSFPENVENGLDRASAVLILNSTSTGRPKAILESSILSAKRTAASAALAAQVLDRNRSTVAGFIGCGVINFEIARFVRHACPRIHQFIVYDSLRERARAFKGQSEAQLPGIAITLAESADAIYPSVSLLSFATTAGEPYVSNLRACPAGTVVLHISLRDLSPDVILSATNVVDDPDHVCRAQTSIHLTQQLTGNLDFVSCSLADILLDRATPPPSGAGLTIFSPFGLGILDVGLGEFVLREALEAGRGLAIPNFLPESWKRQSSTVSA